MTEKGNSDPRSPLDDLRVDPGALEGDPFVRRSSFFSSLRSSGRGWAAAAIAVGVLVLAWKFRAPVSEHVAGAALTDAGSLEQAPATAAATALVSRLYAANPSALKQQIVDDLRAVGVEAIGYDRLGLSGVDAQLARPVPEAVRATLAAHGVALPADGVVRIEITQAK